MLQPGVDADDGDASKRLQDHVKATIAPYKYPRSVKFVDALPKTPPARSSAFVCGAGVIGSFCAVFGPIVPGPEESR